MAARTSQQETEELKMTIMEHLQEMRRRLIRIIIYLAIGTAIGLYVAGYVYQFLYNPAPPGFKPIAIEMTENFFTYFRVAVMTGAGIAMPFMIWEVIGFVAPALTPEEKRYALFLLPGITVCFVAGVLFGYFVTLPFAVKYLLNFGGDFASVTPTVSNYIGLVTMVLFWMGCVFELPIILYFLAKIGLVNHKKLAGFRKYFFVIAFVIAAIVTPTPDPLNQTLMALPLVILWEVGVQLAKLA
jgi:sec-independent protein translocase protein TatC